MHVNPVKPLVQFVFAGILCLFAILVQAQEAVEGLKDSCAINCSSATCSELATSDNPALSRLILLAVITFMLTLFFYKKYKRKLCLTGGLALTLTLISLFFINQGSAKDQKLSCNATVSRDIGTLKDTLSSAEFVAPTNEFEGTQPEDSLQHQSNATNSNAGGDTQLSDAFASPTDEFAPASGAFTALDSTSVQTELEFLNRDSKTEQKTDYRLLYQLVILFTLLILISYLIKYESFRKTKGLFLMASVVYLGFFKGACPCMILSLHNTILAIFGQPVEWISMVWFLGLIPLTYLFGKVWCGWLCHLGGLQEFLFKSPQLNILKGRQTQNILRYVRIGILAILVIQLLITRTNIFIHYDPFKVAFNLFSANLTGYVLLFLLLGSSVLIYRPFCRAVCPVGLILGWVILIPGARQLSRKDTCIDCVTCSKSCQSEAMIYENKKSVFQVQDCVLCGDCIGSCTKNSLYIVNLKK